MSGRGTMGMRTSRITPDGSLNMSDQELIFGWMKAYYVGDEVDGDLMVVNRNFPTEYYSKINMLGNFTARGIYADNGIIRSYITPDYANRTEITPTDLRIIKNGAAVATYGDDVNIGGTRLSAAGLDLGISKLQPERLILYSPGEEYLEGIRLLTGSVEAPSYVHSIDFLESGIPTFVISSSAPEFTPLAGLNPTNGLILESGAGIHINSDAVLLSDIAGLELPTGVGVRIADGLVSLDEDGYTTPAVTATPSDNVQKSDVTPHTITETVYTQKSTVTVPPEFKGAENGFRVIWEVQNVIGDSAKSKIYINGVAVGVEKIGAGTHSDDIGSISAGDTIEIWAYVTAGDESTITTNDICADLAPYIVPISPSWT